MNFGASDFDEQLRINPQKGAVVVALGCDVDRSLVHDNQCVPGDVASADMVADPRVTHLQFVYKRPTVTAGPEHAAFPLHVSNPHVRLLSWQKADEIVALCAPLAEEEVWKIFSAPYRENRSCRRSPRCQRFLSGSWCGRF
jgi:hypothetical protein